MNILFVTEDMHQGSSLMRAYWPSMWINKFTEHRSYCIDARQAASQQAMFMIDESDIVVCHKHHDAIMGAARYAKEQGKKLVFETDDYDEGGFDNFYNGYYLLGFFENLREMVSIADGVTCGSQALAERTDHPSAIAIENGFDFYLNCYSVKPKAYFTRSQSQKFTPGKDHCKNEGWDDVVVHGWFSYLTEAKYTFLHKPIVFHECPQDAQCMVLFRMEMGKVATM